MASPAPKRMTLAEFLDWEDGTDTRYELVGGRIVAMAPPAPEHSRIIGNLAGQLARHLKPPCGVYVEAGIVLPDRADTYYQADLAVSCTPLEPGARWVPDPILVVEALSPSTLAHDRGLNRFGSHSPPLAANTRNERRNTPPLAAEIVYCRDGQTTLALYPSPGFCFPSSASVAPSQPGSSGPAYDWRRMATARRPCSKCRP
jgi:Putative restriction endonuclease